MLSAIGTAACVDFEVDIRTNGEFYQTADVAIPQNTVGAFFWDTLYAGRENLGFTVVNRARMTSKTPMHSSSHCCTTTECHYSQQKITDYHVLYPTPAFHPI